MHGLLVPLEGGPVSETPATHAAAVRSLLVLSVDPCVSDQAVWAAQALPASFAHDRLRLLDMLEEYMTIQAVLVREALGAIWARQVFPHRVSVLVPR